MLAWDDRVHRNGACYRFDFRTPARIPATGDLVFSASQADIDTLPKGFAAKGPRRNQDRAPLDWSIVLVDAAGQTARLPLSHDQVLYPQLKSETRRAGLIDRLARSKIVMRRFKLALRDFTAVNPKLDAGRLSEIRFEFDRSRRGAIALDEVGLAPGAIKPPAQPGRRARPM